jgi:SAM-dependent methyltransferase
LTVGGRSARVRRRMTESASGAAPFDRDVASNDGYRYTTNASWSSVTANERLTQAALAAESFRGKRVLDVGCGDGTYTLELCALGAPARMCGLDAAAGAIERARRSAGARPIDFCVGSAEELPFERDSFDLVHLRGVLHHLDHPRQAIVEALRVAPKILVIEPNGYNPVLKLIEKASPYHREHKERSFAPRALVRWCAESGARVRTDGYAGLVPFFCPESVARALKRVEPMVERLPVLSHVACAVYVFVAER